jgi:serine/threonine protein kinase/tetratricopeptide (TPR) repeat protein
VTPDRFETIKRLVLAAESIGPAERAAWLDRECASDASLRDEVASLLSDDIPSILETGGLGARLARLDPAREPAGRQIGAFRITDVLGEGGMGIVYRAEQTTPIRRDVALKLVPRGPDSARVIARFESERQTLARMSHPYIAHVFEAGADDEGRPFFAMELVDGEPVTDYCARESPPLEVRLRLFLQICEAVQHAHQRGIIHRDLKPSNVLLTRQGSELVPKVIDFGIAKAIGERDNGTAPATMAGQMIGTPEYMSPEQAGIIEAGLDTRTDVYSLGVILYELVSGRRPYQLPNRTAIELDRAMRTPPVPPSRAAAGPGSPSRSQALRDIDAVALMAIEREPNDRYASVEQLAEDVRRVLEHRPVRARTQSWSYRTSKFIRRHAAGAVTALLVVVLAALGITGIVLQRNRAVSSERLALNEAARARAEADKATAVADFLTGLFRESDPANARGTVVTARELLDRGARQLSTGLGSQDPVRATLLNTIGGVYRMLGLLDDSEKITRQALEIRQRALGPDHADIAKSLDDLGQLARERTHYEEAEKLHRAALAMRRKLLAPDDPAVAESLSNLALALRERGKFDEAESLVKEALTIRRAKLGPEHSDTLTSLNVLGDIESSRGRYVEAERAYRDVLDARRRLLPADHPRLAVSLNNVAGMLHRAGRLAEAEVLFREALAIRRKVLDPDHLDTTTSVLNLAAVLQDLGKLDEAEPLFREAIAADRRHSGSQNMDVAIDLNNLASLLEERGAFDEAGKLYEESKAIRIAVLGEKHASVATIFNNIGRFQLIRGDLAQAETALRRALDIRRALGMDKHPRQGETMVSLGRVFELRGRRAEAEEHYRAGLALQLTASPDGSLGIATAQIALGHFLIGNEKATEAEPLVKAALAFRRQRLPAGHRAIADAEAALGDCLLHQSKPQDAEPLLVSALQSAPTIPSSSRYSKQSVQALLDQARRSGKH